MKHSPNTLPALDQNRPRSGSFFQQWRHINLGTAGKAVQEPFTIAPLAVVPIRFFDGRESRSTILATCQLARGHGGRRLGQGEQAAHTRLRRHNKMLLCPFNAQRPTQHTIQEKPFIHTIQQTDTPVMQKNRTIQHKATQRCLSVVASRG